MTPATTNVRFSSFLTLVLFIDELYRNHPKSLVLEDWLAFLQSTCRAPLQARAAIYLYNHFLVSLNPGTQIGPYAGRESEQNQNQTIPFFGKQP